MQADRRDVVWKSESVVQNYLTGTRAGIPLALEQFDVIVRVLKASQMPMERFLDLGCGDGILGHVLLDAFPQSHGVFLDFSEPMLEAARQRLTTYGNRALFVHGDYGDPGWTVLIAQLAPFDAVVSSFSIHHQPDEQKRVVYQQIYDLLKPGGVFLNLEHVAPPSAWVESLFDDLMIDTTYANQEGKTRDEVAHGHHNRPDKEANILAPLETQCEWLRDIGFEHVDCYLKILELALFGGVRPTA
jgi:ubiquinone/menaquinone biosynthesis C-methylase UbiE